MNRQSPESIDSGNGDSPVRIKAAEHEVAAKLSAESMQALQHRGLTERISPGSSAGLPNLTICAGGKEIGAPISASDAKSSSRQKRS